MENEDKVTLIKPLSTFQAWNYISLGVFFFLFTGGKGTKVASWGGLGTMGIIIWNFLLSPAVDNYITDRVNIERRQPLKVNDDSGIMFDMSLSSQAFASPILSGNKGKLIKYNRVPWAYVDTSFEAYKVMNEQTVMLYDKKHPKDNPVFLNIPNLNEKIMQYKK